MIPRPEILDNIGQEIGLYFMAIVGIGSVVAYYLIRAFRGPRPRP